MWNDDSLDAVDGDLLPSGFLVIHVDFCFVGVAPPSFGFISAGFELYELTTTGDAFSFKSITLIVIAAIISLLPVVFRRRVQQKLE